MERNHTKVSLVIPILHYPPVIGGFEVFLENVAERLTKTMPVHIITGKVAGVPARETRGNLSITRTASLFALRNLSYSSYWYVFSALPILFWQTWRTVKRVERPLMHANGFFSGLVCFAVFRITRVPYVITIQSADFTIYHPEARFIVRLQMAVERVIYRNASVCHAVSNDLCKHYHNQGVAACVMIPNGVEREIFKPLSASDRATIREIWRIPAQCPVVVTTSRLEHKNGVHDLIGAVAKLPDVHLVIVGDGSKRGALEDLAKEKGIVGRVLFLGQLDRPGAGRAVAAADVYARTPLAEGFGIVFLEAMAACVPVVATAVGGIVDFLDDGVTGLFAETGNSDSIADAISRILSDTPLRMELIENGSRLVAERYDWDTITERLKKEVYVRAPQQ